MALGLHLDRANQAAVCPHCKHRGGCPLADKLQEAFGLFNDIAVLKPEVTLIVTGCDRYEGIS